MKSETYKYIKHCKNDWMEAARIAEEQGAEVYHYRRRGGNDQEPRHVHSYVVMKKTS